MCQLYACFIVQVNILKEEISNFFSRYTIFFFYFFYKLELDFSSNRTFSTIECNFLFTIFVIMLLSGKSSHFDEN